MPLLLCEIFCSFSISVFLSIVSLSTVTLNIRSGTWKHGTKADSHKVDLCLEFLFDFLPCVPLILKDFAMKFVRTFKVYNFRVLHNLLVNTHMNAYLYAKKQVPVALDQIFFPFLYVD